MKRTFLTAEWRKLAMANYAVNPAVLQPYVPYKTELDLWEGTCYISLVGFMFLNTRLKGIKIPYHSNFEEINLRFYVRHQTAGGEWKRGVVFIKEIVPRPMLTFVANTIYRENYETMSTGHAWQMDGESVSVEYQWKKERWNSFRVQAASTTTPLVAGSEEEFITEHFWGYAKIDARRTTEYEVTHPRWQLYPVTGYQLDVDFDKVYGKDFAFLKELAPTSVFLAEGSAIAVGDGSVIR